MEENGYRWLDCPKYMYLGIHKSYLDGKNRLTLPKKIRDELGKESKFYIILGQNGEIWGFDQLNWQKQVESILNIPLGTVEGRIKRLEFFSRADDCILDQNGRFVLPLEFFKPANSKTGIWVIGAGDHFEIWPNEGWKQLIR